jgi:hypothetical protein
MIVTECMFPDANDTPPLLLQCPALSEITFSVVEDLLAPPSRIGLRYDEVARTPVPVAAIDEHTDPSRAEHDVCLASERGIGSGVLAEA